MKTGFIIAAAALAVTACTGNKTEQKAFATDSLSFENKTHTAIVTLKADYPTSGPDALTTAVREYISEQLGGTYGGSLAAGDSVMDFYGKRHTARLDVIAKDLEGSATPTPSFTQTITAAAETPAYVTYTDCSESFLGGAHGITAQTGATFRKSDGRRFGWEMLRDTDTEDFRALLKEGLKEYFAAGADTTITDGQLAETLLADGGVDYLPLPKSAPYLTADGVAFVYQPYEIAPYTAGRPSFTVGFDKIRSYLTQTVIKMIDNKDGK